MKVKELIAITTPFNYISIFDDESRKLLFKGFKDHITHPDFRQYLNNDIRMISTHENTIYIYIVKE